MANPTPPLLAIHKMSAGEFILLHAYQGIRFTLIPDGGEMSYSYVNDDSGSIVDKVHDPATLITVDVITTVDLVWPFILVSCDTATGRSALV